MVQQSFAARAYRDDAVVLRTHKLGEADRIITLLTKHHGQVRAVAKGVRRTSSRFGARLEPFMVADLQLVSGRTLDIVTQAVAKGAYGGNIAADYGRYTVAAAMTETAEKLTDVDGEAGTAQYNLLVGALASLSRGDHAPELILDSYLLRALATGGWAPSFTDCARCGAPGPHTAFSAPLGGMVCADCRPAGFAGAGRGNGAPARCPAHRELDDGGRLGVRAPPGSGRPGGQLSAVAPGASPEIPQTCGANVEVALGRSLGRNLEKSQAKQGNGRHRTAPVVAPYPHPSGAVPPAIPAEFIPRHVAIVMDGNGRWANQRGLPRIEGHKAGEPALLDVMAGAIELGIEYVSVYAFSTENWRRSPEEVRFLMGFNKDVLRRQRNQLDDWGVRIRWSGRRPKLWGSVIRELEEAEDYTRGNSTCTLNMCVNYGGRAEIADAVSAIAEEVAQGRLKPGAITERTIQKFLDEPDLPDVDLFLRSSGEQRLSNFMLWQSAYAEFVFMDTLWPDVDRRTLWDAVEIYAQRDRRYGGAVDAAPAAAGRKASRLAAPTAAGLQSST